MLNWARLPEELRLLAPDPLGIRRAGAPEPVDDQTSAPERRLTSPGTSAPTSAAEQAVVVLAQDDQRGVALVCQLDDHLGGIAGGPDEPWAAWSLGKHDAPGRGRPRLWSSAGRPVGIRDGPVAERASSAARSPSGSSRTETTTRWAPVRSASAMPRSRACPAQVLVVVADQDRRHGSSRGRAGQGRLALLRLHVGDAYDVLDHRAVEREVGPVDFDEVSAGSRRYICTAPSGSSRTAPPKVSASRIPRSRAFR